MSHTLFWEEDDVPGRTQLMAAIVGSDTANKVTFYNIDVRVSTTSQDPNGADSRTWQVRRRYSEFAALHKALNELGFPCPELPPKQLWGGHTSSFMAHRQNALNCWIQGVVVIWQSVAPNRPRVAYAIGELLEAFLCSPDSETFYKTLEEVQNEEKTASDSDIDLASLQVEDRQAEVAAASSPFVQHVPQSNKEKDRSSSWSSQPGAGNKTGTSAPTSTFAQVAQSRRRSKRVSGSALAISEEHSSSFSDLPSLQKSRESVESDKISRSAPPEPAPEILSQGPLAVTREPSLGAVGIAIDMTSSPSSQKQATEYVTFDNYGQRIRHSFQPFTARVMYGEGPEGKDAVAQSSGMINACTPVSVPPTPHAQNQFNAQWNQYTSSVLEFVQERLSIVSRNKEKREFNILDRHYPSGERNVQYFSDNEEDDDHLFSSASPRPMTVIDLKEKNRVKKSDASEVVEDADAGAGGSAQGGSVPPKSTLASSYVLAGEHLVSTILKEAEADITDWQFVSNTKDVVVMRRLRPIKKKNLLKVQGPSVAQPSPSPQMQDDRTRGVATQVPSHLMLDGTSSAASSVASSMPPREEISQHCFMGKGVIEADPEEIFDIVRRPDKRHLYDAMLNEELLLENIAAGDEAQEYESTGMGNLLVYYHLFETNRCFLRYARDFCVLQYAKKVKVGKQVKYIVVGASINHARCPIRQDVERATLDLFGWVVEPTTKAKQSKVTYMMHIDFGRSGVPQHLLNTISFRQPLAVHYLRRHIQSIPPEERKNQEKGKETKQQNRGGTEVATKS